MTGYAPQTLSFLVKNLNHSNNLTSTLQRKMASITEPV